LQNLQIHQSAPCFTCVTSNSKNWCAWI